MLSIAEHRACIGSFYTRLRFCYYGKKICYEKEILKYLFSSSYVCTVNVVLVLVSLYFFVNLHFAKLKYVKLIADSIESNPGPDHSKHYNRSVLHDTRGYKVWLDGRFSVHIQIFFAICFSLIKKFLLENPMIYILLLTKIVWAHWWEQNILQWMICLYL